MDIKGDLLLWFTDFFVNDSGINMNANNEKLTEELHKPMIRTVYSRFKDFGCWFSLYAVNKQV